MGTMYSKLDNLLFEDWKNTTEKATCVCKSFQRIELDDFNILFEWNTPIYKCTHLVMV